MFLGVDIGSVSTNAVLIDVQGKMRAYAVTHSGCDHKAAFKEVVDEVCKIADISRKSIKQIVGTGYGRKNIPGISKAVTEITCHAIGVRSLFKNARTIIDIGGQDSKIIRLSENGFVENFLMNDKCSAGTGRFLEVMASVMKMTLDEFSHCGQKSNKPYQISSTCTVFAESEVISAIASGVPKEDIVAGIYASIVKRIMILYDEIGYYGQTILTGGVAKNMGIYDFLKKKIITLKKPDEPQITGALGAALLAQKNG